MSGHSTINFLNKSHKEMTWFLEEIKKKYPDVMLLTKTQLQSVIQEKVHSEKRQSAELAVIMRFIQDYKTIMRTL